MKLYCKIYVYFNNIQVDISNKDKEFAEDIVFWRATDLVRKIFEKINQENENIKIKVNEFNSIDVREEKDKNLE